MTSTQHSEPERRLLSLLEGVSAHDRQAILGAVADLVDSLCQPAPDAAPGPVVLGPDAKKVPRFEKPPTAVNRVRLEAMAERLRDAATVRKP